MRRLLPLVLMLASLQLSAAVYRTNSIGQLLEEIPALTGTGYEAETGSSFQDLYSDGVLIRHTETTENTRTVTEDGTTTITSYDENGNIVSESIEGAGSRLVKNYEYTDNGILRRVIESENDELVRIISYMYSPESRLAAIFYDTQEESVSYVTSSSFTYSADGSAVRVSDYPGLLLREESGSPESLHGVIRNDDGSLTVNETSGSFTVESTYRPDGLLSERRYTDMDGIIVREEEYSYSNGIISSSSIIEGTSRTDASYSSGTILSEDRYSSGVLQSHRDYNADRSFTETVYRNKRAYATISYDADGLRVLSLEVL